MSKSNPTKDDPRIKKTGFAHLIAATTYSAGGFKCLFGESAFRQELVFAALLLIAYFALGVAPLFIVISVCLILTTFAVEALNTAIELVVDRTSPEISDYAKNAKDLGSFATMCLLIANGVFALFALGTELI
jgi:diacylglycerol kinase (ATP)